MALTQFRNLETNVFQDLELNSTAEAIAVVAITLFSVEVDNSGNNVDVFLKLWDDQAPSAPSVGTDDPVFVFKVPAGEVLEQPMTFDGLGRAFSKSLYAACVTTGGTNGSAAPANKVTATFKTS